MKTNPQPGARPATRKIFDIMPPGKAPASATSRPVIVSRKPAVAEDINGISAARTEERAAVPPAPAPSGKTRVTVQPAGTLNQPVQVTAAPRPARPNQPAPAGASVIETLGLGEVAINHEAATTTANRHNLAPAALDRRAAAPPSRQMAAPPAPEPKDAVDPLSEFAFQDEDNEPIISPRSGFNWSRFLVILLVVALLGLVIMNFLLDLNILNADSPLPHTDFFKETPQ